MAKRATSPVSPTGYASVGRIRRFPSPPSESEHEWNSNDPRMEGWVRGKARIENGDVVLSDEGRTTYQPEFETEPVLLKFVNLDTENSDDVVQFVEQFGLLTKEGLENSREPLSEWEKAHAALSPLLYVYLCIEKAREDDQVALRKLMRIIARKYKGAIHAQIEGRNHVIDDKDIISFYVEMYNNGMFGEENSAKYSDEQAHRIIKNVYDGLIDTLNPSLKAGVFYGISLDYLPTQKNQKNQSVYSVNMDLSAEDLYHYLLLQLSLIVVDSKPIRQCSCGRYFPATRSDRVHCSEECGGNKRSKKSRNKSNQSG